MPLLPVTEQVRSSYSLHLNLGAIQGESLSAIHPQEIEVHSFSLGASNSAVRSAAGSSKGGKPTVSEMTVSKPFDKATPQLFSALVTSQLIKSAILSMSKSTGAGKLEDYLVITMTGVYITSIQEAHSRDMPENQKGSETISLNFQKITIDYKVQLTSGLMAQGPSVSYDLTKGM